MDVRPATAGAESLGRLRLEPSARRSWRSLVNAETVLVGAIVAIIAYLAVVPVGYLAWRTFFEGGQPTLAFFREAYSVVGLSTMVANSFLFATGSTVLAVAIGTLLAYLVVRTDIPLKPLWVVAILVPLIVPGVLYTICWIFLAGPRAGLLNRLLEPLFGPATIDIFSMGGMIVVEGLHLAPLVFLLMVAAFRSLDSALEESALVSSARLFTVVRRISLPLVRPALYAALLVMFVRALEGFEVPALLGLPAGTWVFTSRIWRALTTYPAEIGQAGAYSVSLLVLTGVGVLVLSRLSQRGRAFETITAKTARPRPLPLGRWRWPATIVPAAYTVVAVLLPLTMLLYVSTQPFYSTPSFSSLSAMTLENYSAILTHGGSLRAFENSVVLGVGSATAVVLLAAVAAWLVLRTRAPGRWLVDGLASLPIAVPGVVLGTALLFVYLRLPLPIYGTLWILFIAYVTRNLPYGMRYVSVSMAQIGTELEEAARTAGAGWWPTFTRVVFPLIAPGLAVGWILVLIVSMRELSSSILLYSPGSEVLSVRIWELYQSGRLAELAALGVLMVGTLSVLTGVAYTLATKIGLRER